jgi:hypothetical protein
LSDAAPQVSVALPIVPIAVSVPGAVGGEVSPIVALASLDGPLRFPTASSAMIL